MALLKLWNSLLGRPSAQTSQSEKPAQAQSSVEVGQAKATAPQAAAEKNTAQKTTVKKTAAKKPSPKLSLFGSASPHGGLLKQLRGVAAESVLEISAGDGSRAVEVLSLLSANNAKKLGDEAETPKIRYAVIDQFEMGGGEHSLMQFHQTLRGAGIRPQVFPEVIDRGLTRVARTIGSIDLILISAEASTSAESGNWATPDVKSLLARVTHDQSVILFQNGETWEKLALSELGSEPVYRRAA